MKDAGLESRSGASALPAYSCGTLATSVADFGEDAIGDFDHVRECRCRWFCTHTVSNVGSLKPRVRPTQQKCEIGTPNVGFWSSNCSMASRDSSRVISSGAT